MTQPTPHSNTEHIPADTPMLRNLPATEEDLERITQRCRSHINTRALISSAGNIIPIPFADAAVDIGMLAGILNYINNAFGLSSDQIENLTSREQQIIALLIANQGAEFAGKAITKFILSKLATQQAAKISGKQAAKFVPILGQIISGTISYATLRYVGMQHLDQCRAITQRARGWQTDAEREDSEKAEREHTKTTPETTPDTENDPGILSSLCQRATNLGQEIKQVFNRQQTPPPTGN